MAEEKDDIKKEQEEEIAVNQEEEKQVKVEETGENKKEAEEKKQVKQEEKAEKKDEKKEKPAPSGKYADLIKQIEAMPVADLADLVKALEERFGVSAAMPMAAAPQAGAAGAPEEAEEKSSYTVLLKDSGTQKIAVIKAVREINQELGLKEAKDLVDGAPKEIKKDMLKDEAEVAKKKLEAAGASVELK